MINSSFRWFLLCLATTGLGQAQQALCPKHIETPAYPQLARQAMLAGKVVLTLALDAEGKVESVEATTEDPRLLKVPVLQKSAVENIKHWTFAKPPSIPFTQVISYDYEFDASLPGDDGANPISKVTFDLPDRVTILANLRFVETQGVKPERR
jgi:TonB family protein